MGGSVQQQNTLILDPRVQGGATKQSPRVQTTPLGMSLRNQKSN